jgi:hypothetical protein
MPFLLRREEEIWITIATTHFNDESAQTSSLEMKGLCTVTFDLGTSCIQLVHFCKQSTVPLFYCLTAYAAKIVYMRASKFKTLLGTALTSAANSESLRIDSWPKLCEDEKRTVCSKGRTRTVSVLG